MNRKFIFCNIKNSLVSLLINLMHPCWIEVLISFKKKILLTPTFLNGSVYASIFLSCVLSLKSNLSPQGPDERSHIREHKPPDWPSPWQQPADRVCGKRTVFEAAGGQKTVTTAEVPLFHQNKHAQMTDLRQRTRDACPTATSAGRQACRRTLTERRFLELTLILLRWWRSSIFEEHGGGFSVDSRSKREFGRTRSPRGMRRKLDREYFRIKKF